MPKICEMTGVSGGEDGFPVELCLDEDTSRLVIIGYNEAGYNAVDIDTLDLLRWFRVGPNEKDFPENVRSAFTIGSYS